MCTFSDKCRLIFVLATPTRIAQDYQYVRYSFLSHCLALVYILRYYEFSSAHIRKQKKAARCQILITILLRAPFRNAPYCDYNGVLQWIQIYMGR